MEISCSICHEEYTSNANISTTRCGHLFHTSCIQDWLNRSSTCPECRQSCPPMIKIHLNIIASQKKDEKIIALQGQIDVSIKNVSDFQNKLDKSGQHIAELQEAIQIMQKDLEELQDTKKYLEIQVESREREIILKKHEISELIEQLTQMNTVEQNQLKNTDDKSKDLYQEIKLKEKIIKTLEVQLQNKSLELEKEIRNSTLLIYDKIKMQKILDSYKENSATKQNRNPIIRSDFNFNKKPEFVLESIRPESTLNRSFLNDDGKKYSVRIDGFIDIKSPLIDIILYLCKEMGINTNKEDIKHTYILSRYNNVKNNLKSGITLIVDWKSNHLKEQFLNCKHALKFNTSTSVLRITEYNKYSELFAYARKLGSVGMRASLINGNVFTRENGASASTQIFTKQDVDDILIKHSGKSQLPPQKDINCDEQFYAI